MVASSPVFPRGAPLANLEVDESTRRVLVFPRPMLAFMDLAPGGLLRGGESFDPVGLLPDSNLNWRIVYDCGRGYRVLGCHDESYSGALALCDQALHEPKCACAGVPSDRNIETLSPAEV